ncbi:hypothetical protein [Parapedobacter sp. DT-150]|uniref:hypothetical protein n=1 Tax=Parapedobacter sp. DT-150 TaxID=3396162 RepID=UPI003F19AC21
MFNRLGVLSSDALNRDGYVIAFEALEQMIAKNALTGLPQLIDHDFHRPLGWIDIASIEAKRYLVGILFPEKMTYAEGVCRTGKLNRAAELIYLENKELRAKKMGQKSRLKTLPHKG